jgi:hypothetical protein
MHISPKSSCAGSKNAESATQTPQITATTGATERAGGYREAVVEMIERIHELQPLDDCRS